MKKRSLPVLLVLALLFVFPFLCHATHFENLIVFGDSLSDNGNRYRYTDGAIWVETLADSLGADLWDYAYGGATTWYDNPDAIGDGYGHTGLLWQVDHYDDAETDNALYTVWAGANDFLNAREYDAAAANIGTALDNLYLDGARDILVGNLPDMGTTPALIDQPISGLASGWTVAFNLYLEQELLGFESDHRDVNLYRLDAYSVFNEYTPGTTAWLDLFWVDGFHPSSEGHQIIYENAYAAIAPVPEPGTIVLMGIGLVGLAGFNRKKFRK